MERCRCFAFSMLLSSFANFTQSLVLSAVFQFVPFFLLQSRSSSRQRSITYFSLVQLSSVWFSAGSEWDFFYVQRPERVQSHLKVQDCVSVCVYVCTCVCIPDRPTDPQDCCPPGLPAYQAENAVQYCLTDSVPQAASVKR